MNGLLTIHKAPPRKDRVITFGVEVRVEELNPAVKEIEMPQIVSEMPEVIGEVQALLAEGIVDGQERSASIHNEVDQSPPKRKRGRPKKERTNE